MTLSGFALVITLILVLVVGLIIGLFIARFTMKNYFKKNPPISEEMIISMMQGMGQTPNKKKVNQIMNKMKNQK